MSKSQAKTGKQEEREASSARLASRPHQPVLEKHIENFQPNPTTAPVRDYPDSNSKFLELQEVLKLVHT